MKNSVWTTNRKRFKMPLEIEFINHSGFIVHSVESHLMIDPWIDGLVFNNGWDLIAKTVLNFDDLTRVTHIWFSHEHPDHFHPPSIGKIPESIKKNITVLYQHTQDKRVIYYCNT